jgi:hypothetical protein
MNTVKTIFKYYSFGIILALMFIGFIHVYGLLFDTFYAYPQPEIILSTTLLSALPLGLLVFYIQLLIHPFEFKNRYVMLVVKIFVYYGLGTIVGLIVLYLIQLYIFVFDADYYYATPENILAFSLLLGILFGILIHTFKTLYENKNIIEVETQIDFNESEPYFTIGTEDNKIKSVSITLKSENQSEQFQFYKPKLPLKIYLKRKKN